MNDKHIGLLAMIGAVALFALYTVPVKLNSRQNGRLSVFDVTTRRFLEAKNWLEDQISLKKEPYFSPDP